MGFFAPFAFYLGLMGSGGSPPPDITGKGGGLIWRYFTPVEQSKGLLWDL